MTDAAPTEWDANLPGEISARRAAVLGWVVGGLVLASTVASVWPSTPGMFAAFFLLLLPNAILTRRLRFTPCPRCKKPLFSLVGWTNLDIFFTNKCGRCGLTFSSASPGRGAR